MKVGNTINGLTVTDVKRVNKLNLIQFLKEVDNYLQKGYKLDVNSARQLGLVLQVDMFKTEADSSRVISVGDKVSTESVGVTTKEVESVPEESVVTDSTVQQDRVVDEAVVESVVDADKEGVVVEEAPVSPKKTTTRSKKIDQ